LDSSDEHELQISKKKTYLSFHARSIYFFNRPGRLALDDPGSKATICEGNYYDGDIANDPDCCSQYDTDIYHDAVNGDTCDDSFRASPKGRNRPGETYVEKNMRSSARRRLTARFLSIFILTATIRNAS
jgi:hypothetical protein